MRYALDVVRADDLVVGQAVRTIRATTFPCRVIDAVRVAKDAAKKPPPSGFVLLDVQGVTYNLPCDTPLPVLAPLDPPPITTTVQEPPPWQT